MISVKDLPNATYSDGFLGLAQWVNYASDGIFFPIMVLVIWAVVFIATKQYSSSRAFLMASFISMILSFILGVLELMNAKFMYLAILFVALGALWVKLENST